MLSQELYQECKELYLQGKSILEISKTKNINAGTFSKKLKKDNVEIRPKFAHARKYDLNEYYFDQIDTEEKAYILGFIYADGNNLFQTNRVSINLSIKDEEILKKFSNIFYGKEILKYSSRKNENGQIFKYVSLNLYSKHMSQHLSTIGVMERKSHKLTFPEWLDKSLYQHFIRGLIDGDGWIYLPTNNRESPNVGLICTRSINDFLKEYYEKEFNIKSYLAKAYKQDFDVMCEIRVKNYHQCKIFLDWLYKDTTIYLQRKYELYQNFLCRYDNLREQNK